MEEQVGSSRSSRSGGQSRRQAICISLFDDFISGCVSVFENWKKGLRDGWNRMCEQRMVGRAHKLEEMAGG